MKNAILLAGIVIFLIFSSGCITTMVRQAYDQVIVPPTTIPVVNKTNITTIKPTITVSQPVVYPVVEQTRNYGERKIGEFWGWKRDNVSGQKDMVIKMTIYRYKMMDRYQWWSVYNARYYWQFPADGMQYVFVFPYIELVGQDPSQDPRFFVDADPWTKWAIQYGSTLYGPDEEYQKEVRIRQLEETFTLNDDSRVQPFGYRWQDHGIGEGIVAEVDPWLKMGKSNAMDGYVIFQVPAEARSGDLKVVTEWGAFGSAYWDLGT